MRSTLKSGGFAQFEAQYRPFMNAAKIDFSVLDQYPNIRFYMRNTAYAGKDLPEGLRRMAQTMSCDSIESFRTMEYKERTALLNVLEEDQITFHVSLKNKFGTELAAHQQKLSACSNFLALRNLKEEDGQRSQEAALVPAQAPVIPSAVEAAPAAAYSGSDEAAAAYSGSDEAAVH
ncbi:MAG: hypothetical protein WB445_11455 [Acinetobacter sp.]